MTLPNRLIRATPSARLLRHHQPSGSSSIVQRVRTVVAWSRPCTMEVAPMPRWMEFGIHDHAVGPGLREVEALDFVEINRGRAGNAEFRCPNLFRLTHRATKDKRETNEWRQIGSIAQAEKLLAKRPRAGDKAMEASAREKIFTGENRQRNLLVDRIFRSSSMERPPEGLVWAVTCARDPSRPTAALRHPT
jgi:hypothetical protein